MVAPIINGNSDLCHASNEMSADFVPLPRAKCLCPVESADSEKGLPLKESPVGTTRSDAKNNRQPGPKY